MNYLITGPRGFIGSNLVAKLKSQGHSVCEFGRGYASSPFPLYETESIIHCAASVKNEDEMIESNILFTNTILNLALNNRANIKSVVLVGSSSEYGITDARLREDLPIDPYSLYDATKGAATLLGLAYARQYGLPVCIARPMSVYGPGDKDYHFIPKLYDAAVSGETFSLFPGVHDWVYVDDFVDGLIMLSQSPAEKITGDIVNFGTGSQLTNNQVVTEMSLATGAAINVKVASDTMYKYDQRKNWVCDTTHALMKYGWAAKTSFTDGIKKYVDWRRGGEIYDIGAL